MKVNLGPRAGLFMLEGAAYSSITVLRDGAIGLFFEKDDYRENVFVRIPFDWVVEKSG